MARQIFFRRGKIVGLALVTSLDIEFCTTSMNDPEITQYLMRRFPVTLEEEKEWVSNLHKRTTTDQVFGIAYVDADKPIIGMMGLHRIDWVNRTATTGAWIAKNELRGKGIGSEAKLLLLDYAFNTLMLRKICSSVLATNARSRRYNEKCGYKVEGILAKQVAAYGDYVDEVRMAIFREDFEPIWQKYQETSLKVT